MSRTNLLTYRVRLLTAAVLCLGLALAMSRAATATGADPVPDAGPNLVLNEDTPTWFNGTAVDPEGDAMTLSWAFPTGDIVDGAEVEFTLPDPGNFDVFFYANDGTTNASDSISVEVLDITGPTVVIADGPDLVTDEDAAFAIDGNGSFDNVAVTDYYWTVFDVDTTENFNTATISYTWAQPGTYTVSLTAFDDAGNQGTGSATVTVLDVTPPSVTFTLASSFAEDTEQEMDGADSTDNVGIVSFAWDIGDFSGPVSAAGPFATHTWAQPGTYDVVLAAADAAGNVGTSTVTVTVLDVTPPAPAIFVLATFNEDTPQTMDASGSYDNVGVVSWEWAVAYAGGTSTLSGETVTFAWDTPGTYLIELTVADAAGNSNVASTTVTVLDITPPIASMTVASTFKVETLQTLDGTLSSDNVGVTEYRWIFADGADTVVLFGSTVTYSWLVPGDVVVALLVSDAAGFMDTAFFTVTALENIPPVAVIAGPSAFDERTFQTFDGLSSTDNVGVVSWQWLIEDAGTTEAFSGISVDYIWTTPGVYAITLTVADAAENTGTAQVMVEVLDATAPTAVFTLPTNIGNVVLTLDGTLSTDNVAIVSWQWTLEEVSGPVTLTGDTVSHAWLAPGSYLVTLAVADAAGNIGTASHLLVVVDTVAPSAVAGPNQRADEDTTVTFDAAGTTDNDPGFPAGALFTWTFTDGGTRVLTGAVATWVFHTPGTFGVTLDVYDARGNSGTATTTVTVIDLTAPTAAFTLPFSVAEDTAFTLDGTDSTDNVAVTEWFWTIVGLASTGARSGETAAFTWDTPGLYTVTLTVFDAAHNSASTTKTVLIADMTPPVALAGPDIVLQEDQAAAFDATPSTDNSLDFGTAGRYTWFFNDGAASQTLTGPTASFVFATPGTFPVTLLVVDGSGNFALDLLVVTVEDVTAPMATAVGGPTQEVPEDVATVLDASLSTDNDPMFGVTATYEWQILGGGAMNHSGRTVAHTFANPGAYTVVLTVRDLAGNSGALEIAFTVTDTTAPFAAMALPTVVDEDTALALDGSPSTDNVGVVSWVWTVQDLDGSHDLTGLSAAYTWATPGLYSVMLVVADAFGHVGQTSAAIRVADTTAPTGTPTFDAVINEGGRASFWSLVFVDNDIMFEQTRTDVWSFDEFGLWIELQGKEVSHIFAKAGTFVVHLSVADASGNTHRTSFEVLVRDTTPPWITVISPDEGALVPERNVVVTGHFEPGAMLYINGVAIDNLGSFAERVALTEGSNIVTFEVRDAAGNRITQNVHLTVDSTLPVVVVDAPSAGAVTKLATLRIAGHVQDATAAALTVAGVQVLVSSGGLFAVDVPLVEGANLLQFVAVDAAGHRSVLGFSVTRDTRAPQTLAAVTGAVAKDGVLTTSAASVDLAGVAEAGTALQLCTQVGSAAPVCTPVTVVADGTFRAPVTLGQGATTTITLKSTDAAGNEATQTFTVAQVVGATTGPDAWVWNAALIGSLALLGATVGLVWRQRARAKPSEAAPEGTDEES